MKQVVKLVMIGPDDKHLLMYRNDHPNFGVDPDLPGGTLEVGETEHETVLREIKEESGIVVSHKDIRKVYSGTDYSLHGTMYTLFVAKLKSRPQVVLSWEHSAYEWLDLTEFLSKAKSANDRYMHMVYDVLK